MPTNTTTPEAATTTTPATNTNTTPLSAMTGEEVASILVNLIRQNDGVLIQTKLEDALRSTGYEALKNDIESGRALLVQRFRSAGVDIPTNATWTDLYNALNQELPLVLGGNEFTDGASQNMSIGDVVMNNFANMKKIVSQSTGQIIIPIYGSNNTLEGIIANNATSVIIPMQASYQLSQFTKLSKLYLQSVTSISGSNYPLRASNLEEIDLRSIVNTDARNFWGQSKLYKVNILHIGNSDNSGLFDNYTSSLIDITCGAGLTGNLILTCGWTNSIGCSNTSSSLCFDTDQAEYGRTFSNNREKFNYCLRQHFAANLPNRTGLTAYTLTFGSTVLAAFEQATIDAFTAKGWTLA